MYPWFIHLQIQGSSEQFISVVDTHWSIYGKRIQGALLSHARFCSSYGHIAFRELRI